MAVCRESWGQRPNGWGHLSTGSTPCPAPLQRGRAAAGAPGAAEATDSAPAILPGAASGPQLDLELAGKPRGGRDALRLHLRMTTAPEGLGLTKVLRRRESQHVSRPEYPAPCHRPRREAVHIHHTLSHPLPPLVAAHVSHRSEPQPACLPRTPWSLRRRPGIHVKSSGR